MNCHFFVIFWWFLKEYNWDNICKEAPSFDEYEEPILPNEEKEENKKILKKKKKSKHKSS